MHPNRSRGFTLIELLVALAIMAMLALLSWRSIDGKTMTVVQSGVNAKGETVKNMLIFDKQ